ncbi:MAG: hypothetical protein AAF916_06345 [Planctomycetota bacterium]
MSAAAPLFLTLAQEGSTAAETAAASSSTASSVADRITGLFEAMTTILGRGDALTNTEVLIDGLSSLGMVWAVVLTTVGLLCMFNGYRWHRVATVTTALLLGLFAGYWLGKMLNAPFVVAGCLGALLFVVAFPLMKYMVAALGGLAGAFLGANLWAGVAKEMEKAAIQKAGGPVSVDALMLDPGMYWVGALIGLIVCGMLAFVLWKLSIVVYTSVSGSTLAVIGVLALLLSIDGFATPIKEGLSASYLVVPLLVFVPAAIGLILQETRPDTEAG